MLRYATLVLLAVVVAGTQTPLPTSQPPSSPPPAINTSSGLVSNSSEQVRGSGGGRRVSACTVDRSLTPPRPPPGTRSVPRLPVSGQAISQGPPAPPRSHYCKRASGDGGRWVVQAFFQRRTTLTLPISDPAVCRGSVRNDTHRGGQRPQRAAPAELVQVPSFASLFPDAPREVQRSLGPSGLLQEVGLAQQLREEQRSRGC